MKRKHKSYSRPKRPFDKARIDEEAIIIKEFGLKNKKEIWKADAQIKKMREKAKKLIGKDESEQKALFERLNKIGMDVHSIADILALEKQNYLKRRLQTIVFKKELAQSVKEARQMITHKKILVDGRVVNKPSYIVPVELEGKITAKPKKEKKKKEVVEEKPAEEVKEEVNEEEKTE
jgi:small subunit ribosomal protein S4